MLVESRKISDLTVDPANARKHDDRNVESISKSLKRFGQQKPIVIDSGGVVRAGNGTLEAARQLDWESISVVVTSLPAVDVSAYAIADNRTSELATWDDENLGAILSSLHDEDIEAFNASGFNDKEFENLMAELAAKERGLPGDGDEDAEPIFTDEQIINAAFDYFRRTGFPYRELPLHEQYASIDRLSRLPYEKCETSNEGYHVADTYHRHRFDGSAKGYISPIAAFADDKRMRRAIELVVENDREVGHGVSITPGKFLSTLVLVLGTQSCANFRPAFAMRIYRTYCESGSRVLDTSTGYGGRLLGAIASRRVDRYVGIDPSTKTHEANVTMADSLGFADHVELINKPAEDVTLPKRLLGNIDFAFTSPPYFVKEEYADEETQSFKRYPTQAAWRDGFLLPMFELQYRALKSGSRSVVNIADVKINGKLVPVETWAVDCAEAVGFKLDEKFEFGLIAHRFGSPGDSGASEPVFVFVKD